MVFFFCDFVVSCRIMSSRLIHGSNEAGVLAWEEGTPLCRPGRPASVQ